MSSEELFAAARVGNREEVDRILKIPDGKAPDPDERDKLGRTAMHLAAWAGFADVVTRLAEAGADVDARASDDITSAHFAAQKVCVRAACASNACKCVVVGVGSFLYACMHVCVRVCMCICVCR